MVSRLKGPVLEAERPCASTVARNFWRWLRDETRSRPDAAQLLRVPKSHLVEVAKVPLSALPTRCRMFIYGSSLVFM